MLDYKSKLRLEPFKTTQSATYLSNSYHHHVFPHGNNILIYQNNIVESRSKRTPANQSQYNYQFLKQEINI